jgi:hypothetical protein
LGARRLVHRLDDLLSQRLVIGDAPGALLPDLGQREPGRIAHTQQARSGPRLASRFPPNVNASFGARAHVRDTPIKSPSCRAAASSSAQSPRFLAEGGPVSGR